MTYIINMASGEPYPDDEPVSPNRQAQRSEPASVTGVEHPLLQLAMSQLTGSEGNTQSLPAGLDITELLQALQD